MKHLIFTCRRAGGVWKQLGVGDEIESFLLNEDGSESVLTQEVIRRGVSPEPLTGAWYIWWERDDIMYMEKDCNPPTRAAMSTAAVTKNYAMARKKTCHVKEGWRRPSEGKLMIHIDAGFDRDSITGRIIRDSGGVCIAAANSYLPHVVDTPTAEAEALRDGLMLAQQPRLQHIRCPIGLQ
jgi:hypothetical protein